MFHSLRCRYLSYTLYTCAHTCASCISWGTINNRVCGRWPKSTPSAGYSVWWCWWTNLPDQVLGQGWLSSGRRLTNTNLVFLQASPGAFATSLCFKYFFTLSDALGDRSCVINNWCIIIPWRLLNPGFIKRTDNA